MAKPGETWETDKPYDEVVELIPHLRALGVSTVWVREMPLEHVDSVCEGSLKYDDVHASVTLSIVLPDVEIRSSVDLVEHRGSTFRELDVDRVSTLLQRLPEGPRSTLLGVVECWHALFQDKANVQARQLTQLVTVREQLAALVAKATADAPEDPHGGQ